MVREPVRSSAIRSIGYDANKKTLEVEFANGRVYQYRDVPEFLFQGFCLAASKGDYFNTRISDRFSASEV